MSNDAKIIKLKEKLKKYYEAYMKDLDDYDCGANLAEYISGRISYNKRICNETLDELAKLDPTTPSIRF